MVDSETHLIRDFQMTNQVTDHDLLNSTLEGIREETEGILETVADRGYESEEDMMRCLENRIIPMLSRMTARMDMNLSSHTKKRREGCTAHRKK